MDKTLQNLSLNEISQLGEKYYKEELRGQLEETNLGDYLVLDVEQKNYKVNSDRLVAVQEARKEFGDKLFYIIQIGGSRKSNNNFMSQKYAWNF